MSELLNRFQTYLESQLNPRSPWVMRVAEFFFGTEQRMALYERLASHLECGVQLKIAVEELKVRAEKKSRTDTTAIIIGQIYDRLLSGSTLAKALRGFAPLGEILLIQAGDRSGTLHKSLQLCVEINEAKTEIRSAVVSAILEPVLLTIMIGLSLAVMSTYVIPEMALVYDPSAWHGVAASLYWASECINSVWSIVFLFFVCGLLFLIIVTLPKWIGQARSAFDSVPPWSIYRLILGGSWVMSLSALMQSGMQLTEALSELMRHARMRKHRNDWLLERIQKTLHYLRSGESLGSALDMSKTGFPDPELIEDLLVFSRRPDFDVKLHEVGQRWMGKSVKKIKQQSGILNMAAWAVLGVVMCWMIYGIVDMQNQMADYFSNGSMRQY